MLSRSRPRVECTLEDPEVFHLVLVSGVYCIGKDVLHNFVIRKVSSLSHRLDCGKECESWGAGV